MTTVEIEYLDGEHVVEEQEPNSIAELKPLIGEAGIVDETVSNLRYRNKYPRVYKKVSDAIVTEFPKEVKKEVPLKGGAVRKVYISHMDHIRAYEKSGGADAKRRVDELFQTIGPAEPLFVKGERGLGGRISKAAVDNANLFFAQGDDVVEDKVSVIEAMVPGYKVGRDAENAVTPESLARGIQAVNRHLQKQAAVAAKGALGT